ncbi:MAG: hypothetical protein KDA49_09745 [Rhodospirillaceae bacterium]|nr:hypothetical protein [Rhodospirillaceae bacterium]MCA8932737.1 hypothetical protein [Rhodospirillaceae bacterium]
MAPTQRPAPTRAQLRWLRRGLSEPGGKLPLFDERGVKVGRPTVEACLAAGWAERWFDNPLKPDWLVCKLTPAGRAVASPDGTAEPRDRAAASD